mgnify:CR=1 FL=1
MPGFSSFFGFGGSDNEQRASGSFPGAVAIIGSGSWATAVAKIMLESVPEIWWYVRRDETIEEFRRYEHNPTYLTTVRFPMDRIHFTSDINEVAREADTLIFVTPSPYLKAQLKRLKVKLHDKVIMTAIKGIVPDENVVCTEYFRTAFGVPEDNLMVLGGPSHAEEVALDRLTYLTVGCNNIERARVMADLVANHYVKTTVSADVIGIEYAAVLKNVYAIALGIADGLETATKIPHHNLKAAAFTQATKEMSQLCANLGGQTDTPCGLAGIGDLEVTGLSGRNKIYGTRLGQGQSAPQAYKEMQDLEQTVEGVSAAALAVRLVAQFNDPLLTQQLPLLHAVAQILAAEQTLDVEAIISQAVLPQPAAPIADMVRIYGQDSGADQPKF